MSSNRKHSFSIRSKTWIVDKSGKMVFGRGRLKIFEAVERNGSILAAAKELKMSYRGVWERIRTSEERLGQPLLIKNIGGRSGGGSRLTPFAENIMALFREFQKNVKTDADRQFEETFLSGLVPRTTEDD